MDQTEALPDDALASVELHALANATKRPIWWKRLGNAFILQHSPSCVASSGLNVDQKCGLQYLYLILH
jgi:hypothetical protein